MAVDTPATIAILGGGPVGLEAGLYARFLGYDVEIFERGRLAEHVLRWGDVRMSTPFRMQRSMLGLAALAAQDPAYQPPDDEALLTGCEWVRRYLEPLSQTDLLAESVRLHTTVVAAARRGTLKDESLEGQVSAEPPFHIVVEDVQGARRRTSADVVIDATGAYGNPNWAGQGRAEGPGDNPVSEGPPPTPKWAAEDYKAAESRVVPFSCPEPNFYVLGAKSCGPDADFLFCQGLAQVRRLFALIGGRADLDLYESVKRLLA